jgi:2,6-dihydroxypseudooxynicotine hydrolase
VSEAGLAFCKRWLHRAVSAGLSAADFLEVTDPVERWEQWLDAWCARGDAYEAAAREALERGHRAAGAQLLRRAALCFHFGNNLHFVDQARSRAAHERSVRCNDAALPLAGGEAARVEIPYEGGTLAGILHRPGGVRRPALVVMINGIDSTKEEFDARQRELAAAGMASLLFDGPGQGEAQYRFAARGDYEHAVAAVIDHALAHLDIDPHRVGVFGISLGGYYAPRAAAFDERIKACISLSGPYDLAESWPNMGPLHRLALTARSHLESEAQMLEHAASFTLRGIAGRIRCPLLVMTGTLDYFAYQQAERLAAEAAGPVTLSIVKNAPHVPDDRDYRYRAEMVGWMAERLAQA